MTGRLERVAAGAATILGQEPYDLRLASLWQHDGAAAYLNREYRAQLISEASKQLIEGQR
jgi:hypothetical protein